MIQAGRDILTDTNNNSNEGYLPLDPEARAALQGHIMKLDAIDRTMSLRDKFQIVSDFVQDVRGEIRKARNAYLISGKGYLRNMVYAVESHRAETSLLLSIENCINANRKLNALTVDVANFNDLANPRACDEMMRGVIITSAEIGVVIDHVNGCMDVLRGGRLLYRMPK